MNIIRTDSLTEAFSALAQGCRPAAGCTNLFVDRKKNGLETDLVDLSLIPELRGMTFREGEAELGALDTFAELEEALAEQSGYGALLDAARSMGSPQIRNRATLGGNLADASPACDAGPALLALNAEVELTSAEGTRRLPLAEFFRGPRKTALGQNELLTRILVPAAQKSFFRKVGLRNALAISVVSLAGAKTDRIRLAMGSVADRPVRLTHVEALLGETKLSADSLFAALQQDISPITDLRASAEYRLLTAKNLLFRALREEFGYEIH